MLAMAAFPAFIAAFSRIAAPIDSLTASTSASAAAATKMQHPAANLRLV